MDYSCSMPSLDESEPKRQSLITVGQSSPNYFHIDEDHPGVPSVQTKQHLQAISFDASVGSKHASLSLTPDEVMQIRRILNLSNEAGIIPNSVTADSEYSEFPATTTAWAIFADKPERKATKMDRLVGTFIIMFQLFTYYLFASEAIEDYQRGRVPVFTSHQSCEASGEAPSGDFQCEADWTSHFDAAVAFFMLSIFLTPEILQALRAMRSGYGNENIGRATLFFACLAGIEVIGAFISAAIAISYELYIGEVTDAISVGVGLLFVRELSARAYTGIRHKGVKQYRSFGMMLAFLIVTGFVVQAWCEVFAKRVLEAQGSR